MADNHNPHILFVALSGIGNFLMQLPTIETIRRLYPYSRITVWVAPRGTAALAKNSLSINQVIEAPIKTTVANHLQTISALRAIKADIGIVLSPGQLIKSALYLKLAGIPTRIGHTYPLNGNMHSHLFLTDYINEEENLHDIEQNLSLVKLLSPTYKLQTTSYKVSIPTPYQAKAEQIIQAMNLRPERLLIGIHAGSAPDFTWKRWPLKNFTQLAQTLIDSHNAQILLFGGPDEAAQNQALQQSINRPVVHTIETDLLTTAAIMKRCRLIVSNDSGLMHLGSAVGVKTFGLFGPTDEKKTGPRGADSHVIRAQDTSPVYNTEKKYNLGRQPHPSILAITQELVMQQTVNNLQ